MAPICPHPVFPAGYPEQVPSEEVGRRFRELLGETEPASVPLNLQVTEETVLPGDIIRQRVTYEVEPGEIVPAYHLFRQGLAGDAPGVLAIHAHGGEEMMKAGKDSCCEGTSDPWQYSYHAARAGFRVLTPDALCFGERQAQWGYASHFMYEVNARLKDYLQLDQLTVRGLGKVKVHTALGLLVMLAGSLAVAQEGRVAKIRQTVRLAA